jgi:hypothetical protein
VGRDDKFDSSPRGEGLLVVGEGSYRPFDKVNRQITSEMRPLECVNKQKKQTRKLFES